MIFIEKGRCPEHADFSDLTIKVLVEKAPSSFSFHPLRTIYIFWDPQEKQSPQAFFVYQDETFLLPFEQKHHEIFIDSNNIPQLSSLKLPAFILHSQCTSVFAENLLAAFQINAEHLISICATGLGSSWYDGFIIVKNKDLLQALLPPLGTIRVNLDRSSFIGGEAITENLLQAFSDFTSIYLGSINCLLQELFAGKKLSVQVTQFCKEDGLMLTLLRRAFLKESISFATDKEIPSNWKRFCEYFDIKKSHQAEYTTDHLKSFIPERVRHLLIKELGKHSGCFDVLTS